MDVLVMIDEALARTAMRELYTSNEVADLLLDLRTIVMREPVPA